MDSVTLIGIAAIVVLAAIAAYALGRGQPGAGSGQIHVTPVDVRLEYRNATGFVTRRKIRVIAYMPRREGRSCLFALCNGGSAPRIFRIDRIISITTLDGAVMETRRFLTEILGVAI